MVKELVLSLFCHPTCSFTGVQKGAPGEEHRYVLEKHTIL